MTIHFTKRQIHMKYHRHEPKTNTELQPDLGQTHA